MTQPVELAVGHHENIEKNDAMQRRLPVGGVCRDHHAMMTSVNKDESTSLGRSDAQDLPLRREQAPRRSVSVEVSFHHGDEVFPGWALNISNGGMRAILEDVEVSVGDLLDVAIGSEAQRAVRVVWVKASKGGAIVGFAFVGASSAPPEPSSYIPPASDPPPSCPPAEDDA